MKIIIENYSGDNNNDTNNGWYYYMNVWILAGN